jgi:hypothetical protein
VKETSSTLTSVFFGDFEREGIYREFISYPILNSNQYIGTVVTSIPTVPFFAHYGDVNHLRVS